jgi:hypothetical protein
MAQDGSKLLLGLVDSGEKGFSQFMDLHLQKEMFRGDEHDLFIFVSQHVNKYSTLPKRKTIKSWANDNATTIPPKESIVEPPKYYLDQIESRNLKLSLKSAMMATEKLRIQKPKEALSILTEEVIALNQLDRRKQLINFARDGGKAVHDEYISTQLNADAGLKFGTRNVECMGAGANSFVCIDGNENYSNCITACCNVFEHFNC